MACLKSGDAGLVVVTFGQLAQDAHSLRMEQAEQITSDNQNSSVGTPPLRGQPTSKSSKSDLDPCTTETHPHTHTNKQTFGTPRRLPPAILTGSGVLLRGTRFGFAFLPGKPELCCLRIKDAVRQLDGIKANLIE